MPVCYTVEEFARALGYQPRDWALPPDQVVAITDDDRIVTCDRLLGHVTSTERGYLEGAERVANPASAEWVAASAFAGRFVGGWGGTFLAHTVFGGIDQDAEGLGPLLGGRVVGQIAGAAGAAALVAPKGMRGRAALGAAVGAWVPFIGAPLAAIGAYVGTRPREQNPLSPRAKRWLWIGGGVIGALLLGGGVAYARYRKVIAPEGPLSPQEAVARAIDLLGTDRDPPEVADAAYPMAYPDCPPKLEPEDPTHAACIEYWWHLHDLAAERLPPPGKRPRPSEGELPTEGPAADMRAWLEGLTQRQRSELRRIVGPKYYDPIRRAANDGDDGKTVAAVLRLKNAVEQLASDDPFEAAKRYSDLKKLLGPKLDELLDTAEKYQGEG